MQGATNLFGVIDTLLALKSFFCAPFAKRIKSAKYAGALIFPSTTVSVKKHERKQSSVSITLAYASILQGIVAILFVPHTKQQ